MKIDKNEESKQRETQSAVKNNGGKPMNFFQLPSMMQKKTQLVSQKGSGQALRGVLRPIRQDRYKKFEKSASTDPSMSYGIKRQGTFGISVERLD